MRFKPCIHHTKTILRKMCVSGGFPSLVTAPGWPLKGSQEHPQGYKAELTTCKSAKVVTTSAAGQRQAPVGDEPHVTANKTLSPHTRSLAPRALSRLPKSSSHTQEQIYGDFQGLKMDLGINFVKSFTHNLPSIHKEHI